MRLPALIVLPWLLTPLLFGPADAQPASAEFLIIQRPEQLRIYDGFEQLVSDPASLGLAPFAAIQIVTGRETLGDGITPVMPVRIDNRPHYLVRDPDTGRLVGEQHLGSVTRVRGARAHWDSLEILTQGGVAFTPRSGTGRRTLARGTLIYRVFSSAGRTYVRVPDGPPEYGWLMGGPEAEGGLWGRGRAPLAEAPATPGDLLERVRERVGRTNLLISAIYAAVEHEASRRLQTPQWRVEPEGPVIRCSLSPLPADSARASTVLLGKHIEGLTLGTRFRVRAMPGLIEVRQ